MAGDWSRQFEQAAKAALEKTDGAMRQIVADGAAIVRDQAKEIVPVQTGRLQKSIFATPAQDIGGGKIEASAGTNLDYADDVEFGKYENPEVHAPPQPFMRTAAEVTKSLIRKNAESTLKKALK